VKLSKVALASKKHRVQPRSGLAVVEFAFLAPVFVFMILGMIEVSRAIQVRQVLGDAARAACRNGMLRSATNDSITQNAKDILDDYLDTNTSDTVKPSTNATITILLNGASGNVSSAKKGDVVTVKVSIAASNISWVTPRYITSTTNIIQTVTMIRQM
jgi:Flp pilus assembly protein TadG